VPFLLKLVGGSYDRYVILQGVVGIVCWGFLAWTASRFVLPGWREVLTTWAVLGFATAPLVVQWDWSALSESPSLCALALICAFSFWLLRRFTWVRLAGLGISALAYVGLRDADIWDVGLVGLVLLLWGLGTLARGAARGPAGSFAALSAGLRRKWTSARTALLAGVVLLVASVVAGTGAYVSHRNVVNIEQAFYVRIFPFQDRVSWFSDHGMPEGREIDELARATQAPPGQAKVVAPDFEYPLWQPLQKWFEDDGLTEYAEYLATHPVYVVLAPFSSPPLTYNNAQGNLSFYEPVGHLSFSIFQTVFIPGYPYVLLMAGLALAIAWRRRTSERAEWRFLVAFALIGLLSMLLAWHGEGMEVTRHMVEGNIEVRLSVLLLLLFALFGRPVTPESDPERTGDETRLRHEEAASSPLSAGYPLSGSPVRTGSPADASGCEAPARSPTRALTDAGPLSPGLSLPGPGGSP
jgi:hypothetical protein